MIIAQYLTDLPLTPYPRFPAELATHSASTVLAVRISCRAFTVFFFSERTYLSIKRYLIYVCYTNISLYIAFGIIRGFT
jgi:hypothetical protein